MKLYKPIYNRDNDQLHIPPRVFDKGMELYPIKNTAWSHNWVPTDINKEKRDAFYAGAVFACNLIEK